MTRKKGCKLDLSTQNLTLNYAPFLKKNPAMAKPSYNSPWREWPEKNVVLELENEDWKQGCTGWQAMV